MTNSGDGDDVCKPPEDLRREPKAQPCRLNHACPAFNAILSPNGDRDENLLHDRITTKFQMHLYVLLIYSFRHMGILIGTNNTRPHV